MKKNILVISIILFFPLQVFSHAPNWAWAKVIGSFENEQGSSVAFDSAGNAVVTGYFESPFVLFGSTLLINSGSRDIFIAKYNPAGNVLWATSAKGKLDESSRDIAIDGNGNIIVSGYFNSDTLIFGTDTLFGTPSTLFLVKLSQMGNFLWAKSAKECYGQRVAVDPQNNILVSGPAGLNPQFDTISLYCPGAPDVFIAKYDATGNALWVRKLGKIGNEMPNDLAVDNNGNAIITGYFLSDTITFDSTWFVNAGGFDFFLAKYDSSGNLLWGKGTGGLLDDIQYGVTTDPADNIIVTGSFKSASIHFGSVTLGGAPGIAKMFLAKYDPAGNITWAVQPATSANTNGGNVKADQYGNSIVTGTSGPDIIILDSIIITNPGPNGAFVAKFDTSGNVLWGLGAGGNTTNANLIFTSVDVDKNDNIVTTGKFNFATATFGSTILVNTNTLSDEMFIARIENITGLGVTTFTTPGISVSPNPAHGNFIIYYPPSSEIKKLELVDVSGRIILKTTLPTNTSQQKKNTENMASGIYFVKITDDKRFSQIRKLIVE